jgi:hypothetical protein
VIARPARALATPSKAAVALLVLVVSTSVAAVALLDVGAWAMAVFVTFVVVLVVLGRAPGRRPEVIGLAFAIGGSALLGVIGLDLLSISPFVAADVGPTLRRVGLVAVVVAVAGAGACLWYIRQRDGLPLLLPALNLLLIGLFLFLLLLEAETGNALVEIGGLAAATGALWIAPAAPRVLRAAVFAQVADLATFGFVWQLGRGEQNPIGHFAMDLFFGLGQTAANWEASTATLWEAASATGLLLMLAKLGLIGFLIVATPRLGRYQRPVLVVATAIGILGAAANTFALLPWGLLR